MNDPPPVRVLCVDDDHDTADSLAMYLTCVGLDARACYDGATALEMSHAFRPSLCLIDLNMPGMDGDELAVRLRAVADWRPFRLVAVTAMSDEGSFARTRMAGFDLHLVKPVDPRKLVPLALTPGQDPPERWCNVRERTDQAR